MVLIIFPLILFLLAFLGLARFIDEMDDEDEEKGNGGSSSSFSSIGNLTRISERKSRKSRMLVGMEIDPSKMDEAADPKVNTLQLWLTAQKIFSSFTRSTLDMPKELGDMLVFVHDVIKTKFPGEEVC